MYAELGLTLMKTRNWNGPLQNGSRKVALQIVRENALHVVGSITCETLRLTYAFAFIDETNNLGLEIRPIFDSERQMHVTIIKWCAGKWGSYTIESDRGLTVGSARGFTKFCTFSFSFSFVSCRTSGRSNPPTLVSSSCEMMQCPIPLDADDDVLHLLSVCASKATVFEVLHLTLWEHVIEAPT